MEDKPGYGNPPKEHQFSATNQPDNPGRKKGTLNRSTIARKWLEVVSKYNNEITGQEEVLSQEDIITLEQIKKAKEGDSKAYIAVLDSGYGAPKQQMEVSNPEDGVFRIAGQEIKF